MRVSLFASMVVLASRVAFGGPIGEQFHSGFGGIAWGMSLVQLVGMLPEGDHYFSTAPGHRAYSVRNDEPLFGVPRVGRRIQYHLGTDGGVEKIAVGIPYERREQLLGALISQFGRYASARSIGDTIIYAWQADQNVAITVRASRDPQYGILEFWVGRVDKAHPGQQPCQGAS